MDHLWFITSRIYCICSYINIHDYFIFSISRVSWGYLRVYMVEPVVICLFSLMRLCKKEAEFVGRIGQKINLDSGVGSKRSDSTIIFSVSCHSNVTTFAPRCTPRIFNNPIIISIIRSITNNDHCMIHSKVSTRQVPVVRTRLVRQVRKNSFSVPIRHDH